jgi:hypothetical protein
MKIKGYYCVDKDCPKRWCWIPGEYQHMSCGMKGKRNTGHVSKTCMHNAYHGCPDPFPKEKENLEDYKKRKSEELKNKNRI